MNTYIEPLQLLNRKKNLFLQLEEITGNMTLLEVDGLLNSVEQRGVLLKEVEDIDATLRAYFLSDPLLKSVISHACNKNDLSPPLCDLYDISLTIKAIVNRIALNDGNIRLHLKFEKDRILSNIQKLNQGGAVVADRYHRSTQTGRSRSFGSNRGKLI